MTDKLFSAIYGAALESTDRDAFCSDWSLSSVFPGTSDPLQNFEICATVWDLAHLTVSDVRAHTGLTQAAFSTRFCLPLRTLQNWEYRSCPPYIVLMLARLTGMADDIF